MKFMRYVKKAALCFESLFKDFLIILCPRTAIVRGFLFSVSRLGKCFFFFGLIFPKQNASKFPTKSRYNECVNRVRDENAGGTRKIKRRQIV